MVADAIVRRVTPDTSKKAARGRKTGIKQGMVLAVIRKLGPITAIGVIDALERKHGPIHQDPITGIINVLCLKGEVCSTGKQKLNRTNAMALTWRVTTDKEKAFVNAYIGKDKRGPWPSPDLFMEFPEIREVLKNSPSKRKRRMFHRYMMGVKWRTEAKDKGLKKFMKRYDAKGRPRHEG